MKRRIISYAPVGLTKMYLEVIENDLKGAIRSDRDNVHPVGTTHLFNRMIAEYFLLKYGKEERQKIRNNFNEAVINDIDNGINKMEVRYEKNREQ